MAKINIIFGSTSGNTELVVDKVAEILRKKNHQVTVIRGDLVDFDNLEKEIKQSDLTIFASPTYGHGILQEEIEPVHQYLLKLKTPGQKFAVIGLGDDKYDRLYNIEAAHILDETVATMDGTLVIDSLHINRAVLPQLETKVADWAKKLAKTLT